jgi:hypothetical protein
MLHVVNMASEEFAAYVQELVVRYLRKEHEDHLASCGPCGHPNAFICEPILHKSMWDAQQDMHPKTLACTFILTGNGKKLESKFAERVLEISGIGETNAPLHIKRSLAPRQPDQRDQSGLSPHAKYQVCPDATAAHPEDS